MATILDSVPPRLVWPHLAWGAVATGVLVALALETMLGLFGSAIGIAAVTGNSAGVGFAASIWALAMPFVAAFLGAYVAVRMGNDRDPRAAYLNGILVWCVALLVGALALVTTFAGLVGLAMTPGRTGLVEAVGPTLVMLGGAAALGLLGALVGTGAARRRMGAREIRPPYERGHERPGPLPPPPAEGPPPPPPEEPAAPPPGTWH